MAHGNPSLVNTHLPSHTVDPLLGNESAECLFLSSSSESVNSCCRGSALTLGDLSPSSLVESFHSSTSLRSLLQSSQTSASLHCSIQRLKQETVWMGIWGSLPLEPTSSPVSGSLCFAPNDSAPGVLSTGEQLAGVSTSAAQARLKWGVPFAKDWSLSAVTRDFCHAEPASVSHRYGHTDSHTWRTKLSGDIQQETLSAAVGSGWLVDTEAGSSYNCSPYFRYQSQAKPALETGGLYVHTKSHSPAKVLKGEKTFDGAPPCAAISWKKDLLSSLHPDGLQVSLEAQYEGAQVNVGVAMYGTPREVCMRVTSPSGDKEFGSIRQLSIKSIEISTSEPHSESSKESEEMRDSKLQRAGRKSSPFSTQVETGFGEFSDIDGVNVSGGERNKHSCQNNWRSWEPDTNLDQSEEPSVERSANKPQRCEESSRMQKTVSREISENSFWSLKVNEQSFQSLCDRQTLTRCFQAWKSHILCKKAAARQLYRQQLLRKGLGALQWAVHLRRMQLEIAQRKHTLALLAVSFCRWKEAVARQSKKQTLQPEPYSYAQSSSVDFFEVGRLATVTTSAKHQLTVGCLKEAEQACRVQGELWTQLHRRQMGDEFCWRAQAIRDVRRLAAFRLWRLQKELLSKEEARLEEARALLKKKQLRNTFQVWRSRCLEMEQLLAVATRIQRNLVSRCFNAWKETVEQKALHRCNVAHLRAGLLRKYFQQWIWMLRVREDDKQKIVNLFILRWRQYYGPTISSVADQAETKRHEAQSWWTVMRRFPEKACYSFDDLCQKVTLQRVFLLWKARFCEHQRADSFSQALEQRRLREALRLWHQMFLTLKTVKRSPKHSHKVVHKDPLALLVSEDLSTSSGFHSNAPATLASQSSLEKEYSLSSSQQSFSSILTAEDVTQMPYYSSLLQLHQRTELPAELGGELYLQASLPPQSPGSGENWFVGGQFQSLALHTPGSNVRPLASYSAWEEDCSSDKEVKRCWHQAEKCCLQRFFFVWSARTQQLVKAQQYCRLIQLSRPFLSWHHWVVENKNRKAAASLKHHIRCCQMAFQLWKKRLSQKVEADRRFKCHVHQTAADTLSRWHFCWQRNHAMRELQQQWAQHSCQEKKRLVMRTWSCQTRKQRKAALFWERLLRHRCLITWSHITAYRQKQREALCCLESARERRLLAVTFAHWRVEFLRAKQQLLGEGSHKQQARCQAKACHRWRLASRGQQALRLGSVATMEQACNYWTKAAAFSQCSRQCSTLIGARKSRKMSLSWSIKRRGCREKGSPLAPAAPFGLFPSAIHRWLMIYRNQSRAERLPLHQLVDRPGVMGFTPAHAGIQSNSEVGSEEPDEKWLGRKYLRRWHHAVMLRQCQRGRKLRRLAGGWQQWKEASRVMLLAKVLDQQRLMEKAWKMWRRQHLQSCVVQNVLEEEARRLLIHAFGRWRQLTTFQLENKGHC
ncbi:uncharacterized protein C1orf167 homolog isoform X2 [Struthio camelus]|uniref:uncharacterized protein C1orf167 homolog isoform X2 n=1 Tax=Struthio camelus TaxID=8801 RepID=UPI003603FCFE